MLVRELEEELAKFTTARRIVIRSSDGRYHDIGELKLEYAHVVIEVLPSDYLPSQPSQPSKP